MIGTFWHNDPAFCRTATSYLTARLIHSNTHHDKFLVPPTWSKIAVQLAIGELYANWLNIHLRSYHKPSVLLWPLLKTFESIQSIGEFGIALDQLMDVRPDWGRNDSEVGAWGRESWRNTDKTRVMELMLAFWRHDAIAWPAETNPFPKQFYTRTHLLGTAEALVTVFLEATFNRDQSFMRKTIVPLILQRAGIREIGDLTAAVIQHDLYRVTPRYHRLATRAILTMQRAKYGDGVVTDAAESFAPSPQRIRTTKAIHKPFTWVTQADPALEQWAVMAQSWLEEATIGKPTRIRACNTLCKYFIANPSLPRAPRDYLDIRGSHEPQLTAEPTVYRKCAEFLEWVLDCHFAEESDGIRTRVPGLWNPLRKGHISKYRPVESVREAMPTRFLEMLLQILSENDWAWGKDFSRTGKQGGDLFYYHDPATNTVTEKWSPVRTIGLWLKLRMPFRTFQIRMLDSGEADTLVYDPDTGQMKPNNGPLASGRTKAPISKGVIQIHKDQRAGRDVPILRINTNKTADIDNDINDRGYDCPYAPPDVIKSLTWLREWQSKFNPISRPTPWEEVRELAYQKTKQQINGQSSCFLFRNPAHNAHPSVPIANSALYTMWSHLLRELEQRLAAQGILAPNGEPYVLVDSTRDETGRVKLIPKYDLHSLRVTLITAFYEAGVPPEILMKIVGHATIVMTLYYTKLGVATISEEMAAGQERMIRQTQQNWVRHQKSRTMHALRTALAWNEEAGPSSFAESSGMNFVFMDVGVCPVGCSKCHVGGEQLTSEKTREKGYGPVPGGRTNCAGCRFIVSGPPFLHGLVAHFNAKSHIASEKASRRAVLERRYEELDAERRASVDEGQPFLKHMEWQKAGADLDDITDALDQVLIQMNALARLIEQSRRIMAEEHSGQSTALVINDLGTIETVFEETTEFDIVDRICQSSTFFESVDPTSANISRMRAYDRMLMRNGLQPAFLDMDEATSLKVGNQLSRLLTTRVGRANALNLLNGTETLSRLGFGIADLAKEMSDMAQRKIALRPRMVDQLEAPIANRLEVK